MARDVIGTLGGLGGRTGRTTVTVEMGVLSTGVEGCEDCFLSE